MRLGGRPRMGWAARGTARLPAVTVEGVITASGNVLAARFLAADDGVAAPGHSYQNDDNTGVYRAAADQLALSTGGAFRISMSSGGVTVANATLSPANAVVFSGDSSPAALTGDVTDWSGLSTLYVVVRVDPGAAGRTINSMASGSDGRIAIIANISTTQTVTLRHDDGATGTAAQRFLCPNGANYVIPATGSVLCIYDSTSSRWRVISPVA